MPPPVCSQTSNRGDTVPLLTYRLQSGPSHHYSWAGLLLPHMVPLCEFRKMCLVWVVKLEKGTSSGQFAFPQTGDDCTPHPGGCRQPRGHCLESRLLADFCHFLLSWHDLSVQYTNCTSLHSDLDFESVVCLISSVKTKMWFCGCTVLYWVSNNTYIAFSLVSKNKFFYPLSKGNISINAF